MQLGDSTRVHCKNNILNSIEKVNSSQFLVLVNFSEVIAFMLGHLFCPRVYNYSWSFHLYCIPSIVLFQVTDFWRAYETISRELGLRWLKVTPTTSDVFLVDTKGSITPKNSKMVGIYDENVNIYIFVDNERFRYKHYFTSNCRNLFKYLQIVSLQIVFHNYFL